MSPTSLNDLEKREDSRWAAADNLRANSKVTSCEYCMSVLGVIFLRHSTNRYTAALEEITAAGTGRFPDLNIASSQSTNLTLRPEL
jgi:type I restriction enzyme M protein